MNTEPNYRVAREMMNVARRLIAKVQKHDVYKVMKNVTVGLYVSTNLNKNTIVGISESVSGDNWVVVFSRRVSRRDDYDDPWSGFSMHSVADEVQIPKKEFDNLVRNGTFEKIHPYHRWVKEEWDEFMKANGSRIERAYAVWIQDRVKRGTRASLMNRIGNVVVDNNERLESRGESIAKIVLKPDMDDKPLQVPGLPDDLVKQSIGLIDGRFKWLKPFDLTINIRIYGKSYEAQYKATTQTGYTGTTVTVVLQNEDAILKSLPSLDEFEDDEIDDLRDKISMMEGAFEKWFADVASNRYPDVTFDIYTGEGVYVESVDPEDAVISIGWKELIPALGLDDEIAELEESGRRYSLADIGAGLQGMSGTVDDFEPENSSEPGGGGGQTGSASYDIIDVTAQGIEVKVSPSWDLEKVAEDWIKNYSPY